MVAPIDRRDDRMYVYTVRSSRRSSRRSVARSVARPIARPIAPTDRRDDRVYVYTLRSSRRSHRVNTPLRANIVGCKNTTTDVTRHVGRHDGPCVSAFTELPRAGPQRAVAADRNPEFVQIFRNSDHYGSSRDRIDRCLHRFRKLHDDSSASFGVVPLADIMNDEQNDILERFYNRCFTEVDTACIRV